MNVHLGGGRTQGDSGAYTDINRLTQMKTGEQRDSDGNLRRVAQEFESMFLNQIFKSMRSSNQAIGEDNPFESDTTRQFEEMHDQQLSINLAREGGGIGLADVLVRQMSKLRGEPARPDPFGTTAVQRTEGTQAQSTGADKEQVSQAALLNRRRLSLPSRLEDRLLAGIVPTSGEDGATSSTGADWIVQTDTGKSDAIGHASTERSRSLAQPPLSSAKPTFSSREEFIETMLPLAQEAADRIGVEPRYLVAQAALETGWGKSILRRQDGDSSYNLFGIKTHNQWQGDSARAVTSEYKGGQMVREAASFRAYDSYKQSFHDLVDFLQGNARYKDALASADDSEQFVHELQEAGYATDPQYASKISQIARKIDATYQSIAQADVSTTRTL